MITISARTTAKLAMIRRRIVRFFISCFAPIGNSAMARLRFLLYGESEGRRCAGSHTGCYLSSIGQRAASRLQILDEATCPRALELDGDEGRSRRSPNEAVDEKSLRRAGRDRAPRIRHRRAGGRRRRGGDREQVESGGVAGVGGDAEDPAGPTAEVVQRNQYHRADDTTRPVRAQRDDQDRVR